MTRPLLYMLVTLALALLAIGLYLQAVRPYLLSTGPAATLPTRQLVATQPSPERSLSLLVRGTILLSFILVCLLFLVGLSATLREWARRRAASPKKPARTAYTDAWKLAGERLEPPPPPRQVDEP